MGIYLQIRCVRAQQVLFDVLNRLMFMQIIEFTNELPKGRTPSALREKEMLRALPLTPTKGSAVGDYL